jgi:hypothetical protein
MEDKELDFLIADLEQENRLLRARNERLEKELAKAEEEIARLQSNTLSPHFTITPAYLLINSVSMNIYVYDNKYKRHRI